MDKQAKKVDEIEKELMLYKPSGTGTEGQERLKHFLSYGIVEYMREYTIKKQIASSQSDHIYMRVKKFDSIIQQKKILSDNLKLLFKIARVILILSLVSLFIVGYFCWLDYVLMLFGVLIIILSIIFFYQLFKFSKVIIDGPF